MCYIIFVLIFCVTSHISRYKCWQSTFLQTKDTLKLNFYVAMLFCVQFSALSCGSTVPKYQKWMGSFLGCSFVELCQYFLCNPADKLIYQRWQNKRTDKWTEVKALTQVKALTALMKTECKNLQTNCFFLCAAQRSSFWTGHQESPVFIPV